MPFSQFASYDRAFAMDAWLKFDKVKLENEDVNTFPTVLNTLIRRIRDSRVELLALGFDLPVWVASAKLISVLDDRFPSLLNSRFPNQSHIIDPNENDATSFDSLRDMYLELHVEEASKKQAEPQVFQHHGGTGRSGRRKLHKRLQRGLRRIVREEITSWEQCKARHPLMDRKEFLAGRHYETAAIELVKVLSTAAPEARSSSTKHSTTAVGVGSRVQRPPMITGNGSSTVQSLTPWAPVIRAPALPIPALPEVDTDELPNGSRFGHSPDPYFSTSFQSARSLVTSQDPVLDDTDLEDVDAITFATQPKLSFKRIPVSGQKRKLEYRSDCLDETEDFEDFDSLGPAKTEPQTPWYTPTDLHRTPRARGNIM